MVSKNEDSQTNPTKAFLTREEAGNLLGVSPWTLRRWELKGVLPAVRLNRRVIRYRRSDIDALAERMLSVGV